MCCKSRLGLFWGLLALAVLLISIITSSWVYTQEPVILNNSQSPTSISFKIGLWKVCSTISDASGKYSRHNSSCMLVKYTNWKDLLDLGIQTHLDLVSVFIYRMRCCTILCSGAVLAIVLAILFALIGHCNRDNKTLIACGLFILGGLSLGTGLVIFVSSLSATVLEMSQMYKTSPSTSLYKYHYGWSFFTAIVAFLLTNMAAAFSISGYLNRFTTLNEMVQKMVPGAERKLYEHYQLSLHPTLHQTRASALRTASGILRKTPPDICTTNTYLEYGITGVEQKFNHNVEESDLEISKSLAGQTIPITIKSYNSTAPVSFSSLVMKYGSIQFQHSESANDSNILYQGFFEVSEIKNPSSKNIGRYDVENKTFQYGTNEKKDRPSFLAENVSPFHE